jgi:hypothetical protein
MKRTLRQMLSMAFAYIVADPAAAQSVDKVTLVYAGSLASAPSHNDSTPIAMDRTVDAGLVHKAAASLG